MDGVGGGETVVRRAAQSADFDRPGAARCGGEHVLVGDIIASNHQEIVIS